MIAFFTVSMSLLWKWASAHHSHCVYYGHLSSSAQSPSHQDMFLYQWAVKCTYCKQNGSLTIYYLFWSSWTRSGASSKGQLCLSWFFFSFIFSFWWTIIQSCICPRRASLITNSLPASCSCSKHNISLCRGHEFKQPIFSFYEICVFIC